MDQERRSQREMMQENEKQAKTTYTNAQAKAAMSRRDNKASKLRVELTDPRKSNYFYEEALKTLRTNIQFAGADIKTILVTSCFPNVGKSDVVFQLAKEMGMAGKKTVLLDSEPSVLQRSRPYFHNLFHIKYRAPVPVRLSTGTVPSRHYPRDISAQGQIFGYPHPEAPSPTVPQERKSD